LIKLAFWLMRFFGNYICFCCSNQFFLPSQPNVVLDLTWMCSAQLETFHASFGFGFLSSAKVIVCFCSNILAHEVGK